HSAAFTLDCYAHLLDEGVGEAIGLADELAKGVNNLQTEAAGLGLVGPETLSPEMAGLRGKTD
ncbi:MAG TPA: hypothetical protein VFD37_03615, partial [Solirubrobacterales bacterium]|nr:hypothetical protein [Solirubrobacterales bacterium]